MEKPNIVVMVMLIITFVSFSYGILVSVETGYWKDAYTKTNKRCTNIINYLEARYDFNITKDAQTDLNKQINDFNISNELKELN